MIKLLQIPQQPIRLQFAAILRRPDVAEAGEQLLEVISAAGSFDLLVSPRDSLDDVFVAPISPDAKPGAARLFTRSPISM